MVDIAAAQVTATIVKEWQEFIPVNDPAEHVRHVIVDLSIDAASNLDYPANGIPLTSLFTAGDADDLGINSDHVWFAQVEGGLAYVGADVNGAEAFPAAYDRANQKLILRTIAEDGSDATGGLREGAITDPSAAADVLTCRMYFVGRKRGI